MSRLSTRRSFVESTGLVAAGILLPLKGIISQQTASRNLSRLSRGFLDVSRIPDSVSIQTANNYQQLRRSTGDTWTTAEGIVVDTTPQGRALRTVLSAPTAGVKRIHLRWRANLADVRLILGDAWERGYGDLEWRSWVPDRSMPWYFATHDGSHTHSYGVRTGANALCFWQVDPLGISLWADVRSGGSPLQLGERRLEVCDVVCREGSGGESSFAAIHSFCAMMCPNPRIPAYPIYGSNDWYWAYGNNSADSVRLDAQHVVELSPTGGNRPFAVIDDGWQPGRGKDKAGVGTWDRGNDKFPDMPGLVSDIRRAGARAGIWIRPLQSTADAPDSWRLQRDRNTLDPTVPEVRQKITDDIARLHGWGFDLIKHDYTSYDLFGRWGFQMGTALTRDGWTFASGPGRTTAEIINELYSTIRVAAADSLVIGCNTVSHLSAGKFEICRTGDDTSGTEWARTRKMGVNTLAFRGPQHGAFYVADADCVGVTNAVPWTLTKQWLDLLSRSGTMLFVSLAPDALGVEQRKDLRAAFALASVPQPLAEPLDWQHTVYPARWRMMGAERTFSWVEPDGSGPP